jgi:hypothetical protein
MRNFTSFLVAVAAALALCGCNEEHMKSARIQTEQPDGVWDISEVKLVKSSSGIHLDYKNTNAAPDVGLSGKDLSRGPEGKWVFHPRRVDKKREMVVKEMGGNTVYLYCGSDDALAWAQCSVEFFVGHSSTNLDLCNKAPFESFMTVSPTYDAQDVVGRLLDFPWNQPGWARQKKWGEIRK